MARKSVSSIRISPNLRCQRIYPVWGTKKDVEQLKTVGFRMTKQQAIALARVLLVVAQDWDEIDITGFRFKRRSDGTSQMTVTGDVAARI